MSVQIGMVGATKYRVFKRSARNWTEFAGASKTTFRRDLTYSEAQ